MSKKTTYEDLMQKVKVLEKEHKKSTQNLKLTQSIAHIGSWSWDIPNNFVEWSDEMFKIHGNDPNSFTHKIEDVEKLIHPDDLKKYKHAIEETFAKRAVKLFEYRVLRPDHTERYVEAAGIDFKVAADNNVQKMFGVVQDVTRQAMTEKKIKQSENRFRSLAHYTPNIVFTIDPDGTILYMNHPPDGVDENEIIGSSMYNYMEVDYHENVKKYVKEVFESGRSFQYECKGIGPLGRTSDYLSSIGPVFSDSDSVISAIISTQDITEKKQIQFLLDEREENYKLLIETILQGVQEVDLHGKIVSANAAYHHMLGYDDQELIGTSMYQIQPEKKTQKKLRDYITYLIKEQPEPVPWFDKIMTKKGNIIHVQTDWNYKRNRKGKLVGFVSIVSDITDRKKMEEELKRSHESLENKVKERTSALEEMNTALSVLLKKRDIDKIETEQKIISNYKTLILPLVRKLKDRLTSENQTSLMMILESNLEEFLAPFSQKLSDPLINLTPGEIQIANMIKQGLSNKEIAKLLNNSVRTITNHRQHIRTKLGLKNRKVNLRSYLNSLS